MKRISQYPVFDYELTTAADAFFRRFKLCSVLKRANAYKSRGIPAVTVFQGLFNLVFNNRSLFMDLKTGTNYSKTGKDTFYRFINSCSVNWMRFTSLLAERIINTHLLPDMIGNLRSFSKQSFRCPKCKLSYRRIPISGKCNKCGGPVKATMHKGNVVKYLGISKYMAEHYSLSAYTNQRIQVTEMNINSTFGEEEKSQMDLSDFF